MAVAEEERAEDRAEVEPCDHHWVSKHQPDFPPEITWVRQCSQCQQIDGFDLKVQMEACGSSESGTLGDYSVNRPVASAHVRKHGSCEAGQSRRFWYNQITAAEDGGQQVSDETWQVHILGPDDLMPPTSRVEAMRQAQMFNAASLSVVEAEDEVGVDLPLMWAVPERVPTSEPEEVAR